MKQFKIAILYTLNDEPLVSCNPGDDIVRDGQRYLLDRLLGPDNIEWIVLNRNHPEHWFTPEWSWAKNKKSKQVWPLWWLHPVHTGCRLDTCDYIINASGPLVYGQRFSWSRFEPWAVMLHRILKNKARPKLLNLALGSQLNPGRDRYTGGLRGVMIDSFIRRISSLALATTCRDPIIKEVMDRNGIDAPLWPCPSLFARDYYRLPKRKGEYVAFNFYPTGTRAVTQANAKGGWTQTVQTVHRRLKAQGHRVRLIFHEAMERELASLFFDLDQEDWIQPASIPEFLNAYGSATIAFTSRVHGAYAAASMGVPALCIGSDTRLSMVDMLGLPSFDYREATPENIMAALNSLEEKRAIFSENIQTRIEDARTNYLDLLRNVLSQDVNNTD